jgi:hypothetical protein
MKFSQNKTSKLKKEQFVYFYKGLLNNAWNTILRTKDTIKLDLEELTCEDVV